MNSVTQVHQLWARPRTHRNCLATLAFLAGLVGFASCLVTASAQIPGSIVLVRETGGHAVFINTADESHAARVAASDGAVGAATSARALRAPEAVEEIVQSTAQRLRVDPALVNAVIRVESEFDPRAVSPKGAMGLMQLMPETAGRLGVQNPFDPRENIRGGVTFLRYLLDRYHGSVPLSLAAYNAGENRVARERGVPAIPETASYVRKVTSIYRARQAANFSARATRSAPSKAIYSYVDAYGVIHFSN